MSPVLYDRKCADLARHFLADEALSPAEEAHTVDALAQVIQVAVESWLGEQTFSHAPDCPNERDACTCRR